MEPKFKDLKFKSPAEMHEWLKTVTFKIIDLADYGQDMQRIWVHESGEILNCDFQSSIYCGKFVDIKQLETGAYLHIWNEKEQLFVIYLKLLIESLSDISR